MAKNIKKFTNEQLGRHYGNSFENSIQRNEAEGEIQRRQLRNSNIQTISIVLTCIIAIIAIVVPILIK